MKRTTALVIAAAIAIAAVFGTFAALRTTTLGASAQRASDRAVAARSRKLNRFELTLQEELRRTPPPLSARGAHASAARIVYRRAAPIVVVKHRQHADDDGFEHERAANGEVEVDD